MTKLLTSILAAFALVFPLSGLTGPDEAQKQLIQRTQLAKKKLDAALAATGAERQKMMREHMQMMRDMMAQMQKAKPRAGMTPEQMREWIDEHMKLMDQMMGQMMDEHHMLMQGMGMQGTDMHGERKK